MVTMTKSRGFYFQGIKRYKRGAFWGDGQPRMCTKCSVETRLEDARKKRKQAVVTALLRTKGSRFKVPVGYCEDHIPLDLLESESDPENLSIDDQPEEVV